MFNNENVINDYGNIFYQVEKTLRESSSLDVKDFNERFGEYKTFKGRKLSDNEYFTILVNIIFYSGFSSKTVTTKLPIIHEYFKDFYEVAKYDSHYINKMLNDKKMIKNKKKIQAIIEDANVFIEIITKFGTFENFINSYQSEKSFENMMLLKEDLEYKFKYLGGITVYHFLTDIGMPVIKPDRVITRIFKRIGIIDDEKQLLKTVICGRKFSNATGLPERYIDIILVSYGQLNGDEYLGLNKGICLEKKPNCKACGISELCNFNI